MKNIQYLLVLLLLLITAQANDLFYPPPFYLILTLSLFIYIVVFIKKNGLRLDVFIPLFILIFIHIIHAIIFGRFNQALVASLIFALALVTWLKDNFLKIFTFHMYWLTIIALILFIPTFLFPIQFYYFLTSIASLMHLESVHADGIYAANVMFYTMNTTSEFRNCGFMWEPGPYASLLSIAIFFELIYSNFKINKRIIVFTIAIITTLSTTGYLSLLALFFFYYNNKFSEKNLYKVLFFFVFIGVIFGISQLYFVGEKIEHAFNVDEKTFNENIDFISQQKGNESYSLGRVQGFMLNLEDFKTSPVFGIGSANNSMMTKLYGSVQSMNGIGNVLAKYGIIGIVLVFVALFKTSRWFSKSFNIKSGYTFAILYLIQTFAFSLNFTPFYLLLLLLYTIGLKKRNGVSNLQLTP